MALTYEDLTYDQQRHLLSCVHESAHALSATALGGRIASAVVLDDPWKQRLRGYRGKTTYAVLPEGVMPQVAYAGPWAEARWLHERRPTQREVLDALRDGGHRDDAVLLASGGTSSGTGVVPLLERCWSAVVKVAQQLNAEGQVTHDHVCTALGIPPEDNGHELSLIRSGSPPGSFRVARPVPA